MNNKIKNVFAKGMTADLEDLLKSKEGYAFGENGRIFMKDGSFAFSSVKGTIEVYNNSKINKYLGACVFKDQVIIFAKCNGVDINNGGLIYDTVDVTVLIAQNFDIQLSASNFAVTTELTDNSFESTYSSPVVTPSPPTEVDFDNNYAPPNESDPAIDYDSYYSSNPNVPNLGYCTLTAAAIPPNNVLYSDCIITLQYNDSGQLYENFIWSGYQNWPIDGKIVCVGVEENSNYKRVKYTDNVTSFKTINVYDPNLFKKSPKQLENFQSSVLLQPRIEAIEENGQLKSMAVQYYYRLITEAGQVTEFSPASEIVYIYPLNNVAFEGGAPEDSTNKSVKIVCNVVDSTNFNEIEVIAAEYESDGQPTNIRTLGIQSVAPVNTFYHYGSESAFGTDIILADLIENKTNWKYCSDIDTKNNKLFASGLRNDPIASDFNILKYNFALHGWDASGNTHSSFLNPDPVTYNKIPGEITDVLFYVKKRQYRSIKIFQSATVDFINTDTGDKVSLAIVNNDNFYVDHLQVISTWLLDQQDNNVNFGTYFPNLTVEYIANVILLKPTSELTPTDFSVYKFQYDTVQVVEDFDDEIIFDDAQQTGYTMIDGAMSAGFTNGTGIRISYRLVEDILATKATGVFNGGGPLINAEDPTFNRTAIKDEIYRLGINFYKDGEQLFVIPMGDIKIPKLGDTYSYINDFGNPIITTNKYINQKVSGSNLIGVRVEFKIEVRLSCEFSDDIDMYQIMYVERTESNRTVLCQGLSAPLMKLQDPPQFLEPGSYILDERLRDKWMLPYHGGPILDGRGFDEFDTNGETSNPTWDEEKRVLQHRSLMYFDSPDIIYGDISPNLISTSKLQFVGRLKTDHTANVIMSSGQTVGSFSDAESYPKFSRKILEDTLKSATGVSIDLPQLTGDQNVDNITVQTHFVNFSVFSNFIHNSTESNIENAVAMTPGDIIPGSPLSTSSDLSNNAMCLPSMPWFYSDKVRAISVDDDQHKYEAMLASTVSRGERTIFIRSVDPMFTQNFIQNFIYPNPHAQIRSAQNNYYEIYDTHALVNIKRTNEDGIYGGRSELAFTKNVYIPLSETIPVDKTNNGAQVFNVQGDGYITLYLRTKNSKGEDLEGIIDQTIPKRQINNGRDGNPDDEDLQTVYLLQGAWCYGVVLESMIEPKFNPEYEFYREQQNIDFYQVRNEVINSAYYNKNNKRTYIPQPFRYKDDPLFTNIVAASEVKLSGEYYDAWSNFLVNEFQELDKNKGAALNLVKFKDELFAIQERQTNLLYIDRDVMVSTDGDPINVKQGSGKSIDGYKVISEYGTSFRRSINVSENYAFSFIDENNRMLIKYDKPFTLEKQYHHDFFDSLRTNPIIDVEAYFDPEYQESNFQITQKSGLTQILSLMEAYQLLNGFYKFKAPLYIVFNSKVFAPKELVSFVDPNYLYDSSSLHQLNIGSHLRYFDVNKEMSITFYATFEIDTVTIFKHISMMIGNGTTIDRIVLETKEGITRTIQNTHLGLKNREGILTVPLANYWFDGIDELELGNLRSEFLKITIYFPYTGNEQKLVSTTTDIRKSYT